MRVGDAGVLAAGPLELPNGRLVSRSLDNRIGAFVVLEALRLLKAGGPAAATVTAGGHDAGGDLRTPGAARAPPRRDLEAVAARGRGRDPCHRLSRPRQAQAWRAPARRRTGDRAGRRLSNMVFDQLVAAAEAEKIPYTIEASSRDTRTDAEAIFNAHRGVATGLVSVPLRYMHSPNEMVVQSRMSRIRRGCWRRFCRRVTPDMDFITTLGLRRSLPCPASASCAALPHALPHHRPAVPAAPSPPARSRQRAGRRWPPGASTSGRRLNRRRPGAAARASACTASGVPMRPSASSSSRSTSAFVSSSAASASDIASPRDRLPSRPCTACSRTCGDGSRSICRSGSTVERRADLRQRAGHRTPHPLVVMVHVPRQLRHRVLGAKVAAELGHIANHEPLVMQQQPAQQR